MARYHIYKLGVAIVLYMIYSETKLVVNGLKKDNIAHMLSTTDYRERRDAGDFKRDGIMPNVDFPTYSHVPKTKFSCKDMEAGYYADIETDCQVFHICDEGRKLSFLCPNGTVFQQGELICDWWFKVNCTTSPLLYEESAEILQRENAKRKSHRRIYQGTRHGIFNSQEDYSSTTEFFQQRYTSRGDRKLDSIIYDTNNKIDVQKQHHQTATKEIKPQPSKNSLEELGIVIGPNSKLPLNPNGPRNNVLVTSYGNSIRETSGEAQEVQETASFVMNSRNRLPTNGKYPNHRETYSDIQDPRHYYQHQSKLPVKPFYGLSVTPQVLSTVPLSSNFGNFLFTTESSRQTAEGRFSFSFKTNAPERKRIETVHSTTTTTASISENAKDTTKSENRITLDIKLLPPFAQPNALANSVTAKPRAATSTTSQAPTTTSTTTPQTTTPEITTSTTTVPPTTVTSSTTTIKTTTPPRYLPSTILQPKPFSLNPNTILPTQASSSNSFIINVNQPDPLELSLPLPTEPTPFNLLTTTTSSVEENVNNMIETLMNVINHKFNPEDSLNTRRPGLIIPPSVGPKTLHSLAIYFANALENITTTNSSEESTTTSSISTNEVLIKDLLTQMTRNNYDNLFKQMTETTTESQLVDENENDLNKENSNNLVADVPNVRVLARVFTEALSAYLEDPETFRKVLHEVRPTEPVIQAETTETDEDEVLNYSDSDLNADHPYLHTPTTDSSISPTWGYILALNTTPTIDLSRNLLAPELENLQSADSQSFVSQFNKIMQELKTTTSSVEANTLSALPTNHWTASQDVQKLWQNALSVNPLDLNEKFEGGNLDTSIGSEEESNESYVHYDLRSLPNIELNSTQVHGILIDFMHENKTHGAEKLQRVLNKLNITENQFLERMKEVEQNPFTRRLILLLINECSAGSGSKEDVEPRALSALDDLNEKESTTTTRSGGSVFKNIDPKLQEEDEDTRALQLLNSLYVIASKFGK